VTRAFRLPALAYLVVLFLLVGAVPIAFGDNTDHPLPSSLQGNNSNFGASGFDLTPRLLIFAVPLLAALFIARTATFATAEGLRVRAPFGSRRMPWDAVRGLSLSGRSVYAVLADGSVRLPCVRVANLSELARASNGRLPEIATPKPKYAPAKRRRRPRVNNRRSPG
jgi:hypothetical protein